MKILNSDLIPNHSEKKLLDRIICFDFDGTLTKKEVLPIVAAEIDLSDEIHVLTEATIKGLIPLEKSLKLRFRLLREISLTTIQKIVSTKIPMYEHLLSFINNHKMECCVITANLDSWLSGLIENKTLNCPVYCSSTTTKNQMIINQSFINKQKVVQDLRKKYKKVIVVGEGLGDIGMFEEADVSIAFAGTHLPVQTLLELSNFIVNTEESLCNLLKVL